VSPRSRSVRWLPPFTTTDETAEWRASVTLVTLVLLGVLIMTTSHFKMQHK
jgi:hypothetical protein